MKIVIKDLAEPGVAQVDYGCLNWLFYAAYGGAHRTVALLMRHGFKADVFDSCGYTPVHYAVLSEGNASKTLRKLSENGSDFVARGKPAPQERRHRRGNRLIHSILDSLFTNDDLRAAQAKLHEHDGSDGLRVLHLAAEEADAKVVRQLLQLDEDVDIKKSCGCSALKSARKNHNPQAFLVILQHIFDPKSTRESDVRLWEDGEFQEAALALACASKRDFNEIYGRIRPVRQLQPDENCSCGPFSVELLSEVLSHGVASIQTNSYLRNSPLRYCVKHKNFGALRAITHQFSNRALQAAEKGSVHQALLYAEMHHATGDIKQLLRDLCPGIVDDVRKAVHEREEVQRKERWERKVAEQAIEQVQREADARRAQMEAEKRATEARERRRQIHLLLFVALLFFTGIGYLVRLIYLHTIVPVLDGVSNMLGAF